MKWKKKQTNHLFQDIRPHRKHAHFKGKDGVKQ